MTRSLLLFLGHRTALLLYVLFAVFPMFWLVKISLTPNQLLYTEGVPLWPSATTWSNYAFVLLQSSFPRFFLNSVIVSLGTALCVTLIASAAGYAFSRFDFRLKRGLVVLLLITQMFPLVMLIAPIYRLVTPLGLGNSLTGLIIVYTTFNVPFATFLMQSFFESIPPTLEEAAMIDGCSRFGAFLRVVIPISVAGVLTVVIFAFTLVTQEFVYAMTFISGVRQFTVSVGVPTFLVRGDVYFWGSLMAGCFIASVPVAILYNFFVDRFIAGFTVGAIK